MNYNRDFLSAMENINRIASSYRFKSGIEWAKRAERKGEICFGQYKRYENAHDLHVRFLRGNEKNTEVSKELYQIVDEWERLIIYSKVRKPRFSLRKSKER